MQARSRTLLEDILQAGNRINVGVSGHSIATYSASWLLKSAVERQFEIIGEALRRLERYDGSVAGAIPGYRNIIGFRHRIAHGYDDISDELVWEIIDVYLPDLLASVEHLLREDQVPS